MSVRDTALSVGERAGARVSAAVARPLFWVVVVALLSAVPVGIGLRRTLPPPLPVLGALPAFSLADQDGKPFSLAAMRGSVWIADFVFTRCPGVCSTLSARMAKIQHRMRNMDRNVQLVSFSVDPDYDTPARLSEYARRFHANPALWTFVTGPMDAVKSVVVNGFKIAMGRDDGKPDDFLSIFHGEHLVLVDRAGRIRGYYDATDESIDRLVHDAGFVANLDLVPVAANAANQRREAPFLDAHHPHR